MNILEYGCGTGNYAFEIAEKVGNIHGIDISEVSIEKAKILNIVDRCIFSIMNAEELSFKDNSFDLIYIWIMKELLLIYLLIFCICFAFFQCTFLFYEDSFDPLNRQTEDGLPVFYIQPAPLSSEYSPVTIDYRGEEYQAKAKSRGASSREFPMKSYTIQFSENQLFHDPEFEFTNKNKIVTIHGFFKNL